MKQQVYLDSRFGQNLGPGGGAGTLFWLQDAIVLPSHRYAFTMSIPFVVGPLTHYVISAANRTLDISYPGAPPSIIDFPLGNHSIDELVGVLYRRLLFGFKAVYSENTNTLHFTSQTAGAALSIGPATFCGGLIGAASETRLSLDHTPRRTESTLPALHRFTSAPTCGLGTGTPEP